MVVGAHSGGPEAPPGTQAGRASFYLLHRSADDHIFLNSELQITTLFHSLEVEVHHYRFYIVYILMCFTYAKNVKLIKPTDPCWISAYIKPEARAYKKLDFRRLNL